LTSAAAKPGVTAKMAQARSKNRARNSSFLRMALPQILSIKNSNVMMSGPSKQKTAHQQRLIKRLIVSGN
jgi:hypothetical protein